MRVASRTVLIVDDDASLRQALERVLVGMGYRVVTAGSPDTAYALLRSEPVDAALLDVRLPTMSGRKPFRPQQITEWLHATLRARDRKVAGR